MGRFALTGCLMAMLSQCADLGVSEKRAPVVRLAKPVSGLHDGNVYPQAYRLAYQQIILGRKKEKHAPSESIHHYLTAADIAYESGSDSLLPLYNHAVGQLADMLVQHPGARKASGITIVSNTDGTFASIHDIIPADCLKARGWRTMVKQDGVGAPVVIRREKNAITGVDQILATPIGLSYPATAVLEFNPGKRPQLRFYDPTKHADIRFWGKRRPLANHLTMPLAVSLEQGSPVWKDTLLKWFGVFVPMHFVRNMQLYMTAPFDADKIPLILVHGLKADPTIWHDVMNELNRDATIRGKYQILAFYYPTGLPLRIPSAALKRELNKLYGHYTKAGRGHVGRQMVIVGHSLGGVLTSVNVRRIEKGLMRKVFRTPVDHTQLNAGAMEEYQYLINGPDPHFVKRVIFIATPHQGSRRADVYPVRLLTSLVKIPQNLLFLKVPETAAALTDFGRSLFGTEKKENSLSLLRSQSATLKIVTDSPIYHHIKYHSIMGDRGKGNTPNSSDGVVDYQSSHLDGASSELIVPSGHNAYEHPKAIEEITRILHLHLKND
ncbi:MAG: hypothetical protein H7A51_12985 [Akkermansiaceae bacterium]|nr:hypothetical protein [Akkermansiaceae bacterium]